jgi:hypothetical protein
MSGDSKSEGVLRDTKPGMCGLYHSWAELGMVENVLLVHRGDLLVDNDQKVPSLEHLPLCHQMSFEATLQNVTLCLSSDMTTGAVCV